MKPNGNGHSRPEAIQADIDRTRGEMDRTLSAIEQRLTPGQLVDRGLDYLRTSGVKEFADNLGGSVKENPLPVALVGIGLAWLMAAGRSPDGDGGPSRTRQLADRAGSAIDRTKEAFGVAKDKLGATKDRLGSAKDQISGGLDRARNGVDYLVREQPLALGAIGLAIGAVLGAAAPRTGPEDRLMGEASDELAEKAREKVRA